MERKVKIAVIMGVIIMGIGICNSSYPFWIWSTKSKKWRNPEYSPLASPQAQFEKAKKIFDQKQYKQAAKEFRKLIIHFPDSLQAPDAQFFIGECFNQLGNKYRAFQEYQRVIDSYPYSKKIAKVVKKEYEIGEYFLSRPRKKWLGISEDDLFEHPAIEIFKKVKENSPYSQYAVMAEYKLGLLYTKLSRYQEAIDSFKELIEKHPGSKWADAARYQLALCSAKASLGPDYDQGLTAQAKEKFQEFLAAHPDAELSTAVIKELNRLNEKEAKKEYDIGMFYEKQKSYKAALIYYRYLVKHYPGTDWANRAKEKIIELEEKVK
ncbi:MAG: outer membrane protein assembly factor BamD [Candidatus Omnitrophica bacterium]|nr:outer membrane protein assembly factor BamD [Candidatus Omnitrophota bacterium]